ncbi:MAG: hypothetical protein JWO67_6943 [Streptosporangiaceae bacterium]|nr:hypothetical protein [Streptosporangiaceae bacterium]
MKQGLVSAALAAIACCASLTACGGGPVTDDEASAFLDVARDKVPGAANYNDDVLTAMAEQVCQVLKQEHTTAGDALDVMDNYKSLTAEEQATIVGIAVGSACPEYKNKITTG